MKDAQCAETNEKSIFLLLRFLVFQLWLKSLEYFDHLTTETIFLSQKMRNVLKRIFVCFGQLCDV